MTSVWLTSLALLPLVGGLVVALLKGKVGQQVGMAFALGTLVLGVVVAVMYANGAQLAETYPWIRALGLFYALKLDGMGLLMVLLTVVLVPVVLLAEWQETPGSRWTKATFAAFVLVLESFSLFVFLAWDVVLFYIVFEATLVPMYFMIGGWGGAKRSAAAIKFLLYSLAGGLVLLFGVVGLGFASASAGVPSYLVDDLTHITMDQNLGRALFCAFFFAFAVKAPMVPVHTWLPDAASQSSPGTATLLVGVLDKIGTFGMIRFCLGLFPEASHWATPLVIVLAVISVLYGAIAAIGSKDLMRLISFTSISHFGFMVLGIFAFTSQSMSGSIFYMFNHGISTAALFLVVGFLVKRRGEQQMSSFGGVIQVAPVMAGLLLVAGLAALSLPGLSTFVSEFLVMAGTWQRYPVLTAFSVLAMVLAALYALIMYQRIATGPVTEQVREHVKSDLDVRERVTMVPIVILLLVLGFFPKPALDVVAPLVGDTMVRVGVTDLAPVDEGR